MEENKEKETKLKKIKRMLAFTGIILLLGLYAATLITSFMASPAANALFIASLVCTGFIPVAIYIFIWLLKFR
jgi:hypothetical protein